MSLDQKKILLTGGSGFLGTHLREVLDQRGVKYLSPRRAAYDLTQQAAVRKLFADTRPEVVFHLAGIIGGILVNKQRPADFFYQNLALNTLTMHEAYRAGVQKFITLMGGCSYPGNAPNPIKEESMWDGYPQPESAPYSIAKKMLIVQSESYRRQYGFNSIVLVPGNLYGPWDNFNLNDSHVIPALIRKVYEARRADQDTLVAWGSGQPVRDFIYARDAAEAIVRAAETYDSSDIINISSGRPTTIRELTETVVRLTGFKGKVIWDQTKPDGQMFKGFDVTRMRERLGYQPPTSLEDGLRLTIDWLTSHYATARL